MASFKKTRSDSKPYSRPTDEKWVHDKAPGATRTPSNNSSEDPGKPTSQLLVANLHYEVTPADLTSIFGQTGTLIREPNLRYDNSGRSKGTAVVTYETTGEAIKAFKQYNGLTAKGQPMEIKYMQPAPPRGPRGGPATSTLLNRIQKAPLADRLASGGEKSKGNGPGPVRSKQGRGGKGKSAPKPREPKKPKTAEDLDKELEAFMGDSPAPAPAAVADAPAPAAAPEADVEMA